MNKSERLKASKHEDGVDFISNLPDTILLLILSRLPSTKEVIGTSILSRRWRYLWTSIPSLDLKPSDKMPKSKFKEFVYWVLLNRCVDLDSFRLCVDRCSMSTLELWIHATVLHNVKRLDFTFYPKEKDKAVVLPHCLVTCASLEVLKLDLCRYRLILPSFSWLPALKVLELWNVELFDDDFVKSFLESFPMLEELTLEECVTGKLNLLCISCPNLKKLRISESARSGLYASIKLFCPKLVFLDLSSYLSRNFTSECMYSLKESVIYSHGGMIDGLFPGISHVESLKTDIFLLSESILHERDPNLLPNLKTLELNAPEWFCMHEHLTLILKHCPELKSLGLNIENENSCPEDWKSDEGETSRIPIPDLKWVEFFKFNGEKPKIDIDWSGVDLEYIYARWGENPGRYSLE